ncbi:aminotransferase family protein [Nocardiopsis deserti]|uniref:aminotransferase family protein n=1 Tax=Nocardiopsis deserti TaxID=2605988 RepID=UPI001CC24EEE|nr:aminotransferase class III-fold pyridoxal phosphate-dependent enzyme [Nocardiopsis deserti]
MQANALVSHARGVHVVDTGGREYLDGCSGAVNANLGHGHPEVTAAMHAQIDRACSAYRRQFASPALARLTHELCAVAPGAPGAVLYANSGSEAVETALRLVLAHQVCRGAPERTVVLSEDPGYHGMTAGALSLSGHPQRRAGLEALLDNRTGGPRVRPSVPGARATAADWSAVLDRVGPDRVAAVVVEPVGGAATGAAVPEPDVLPTLRTLADRHGFLFVADEVMTGLGRTGAWFASAAAGVVPDMIATGKGLTAGYVPMSALVVDRAVTRVLERPAEEYAFGHTTAGNPLAAAAGLAVLEYLRAHDVPGRVRALGSGLRARMRALASAHPHVVSGVRGEGLLLALRMRPGQDRPLARAGALVEAAWDCGLVLYPAGVDAATESVLVAPPLVIAPEEVDELLYRLERALCLLEERVAAAEPARAARHHRAGSAPGRFGPTMTAPTGGDPS